MKKFVEGRFAVVGFKKTEPIYNNGVMKYAIYFITKDAAGRYNTITIDITGSFDKKFLTWGIRALVYEEDYDPAKHFADFINDDDGLLIHVWTNNHSDCLARLEWSTDDGRTIPAGEFSIQKGLGDSFFELFKKREHNGIYVFIGEEQQLKPFYELTPNHDKDIIIMSPVYDRRAISEAERIFIYKEGYAETVLSMIPQQREPTVVHITNKDDFLGARRF